MLSVNKCLCCLLIQTCCAGYPVCTTLGQPSSTSIDVRGKFSSIMSRRKCGRGLNSTGWFSSCLSEFHIFLALANLLQIQRIPAWESLLRWQAVGRSVTVHSLCQSYVIQMEFKYDVVLYFQIVNCSSFLIFLPNWYLSLWSTLVIFRVLKHWRLLGSVIM